METFIDKSAWPEGPWHDEPDLMEWTTAAGYPGRIIRVIHLGHWCGYVTLPATHPYARKEEEDVPVSVHGGLTYSNYDIEMEATTYGFDCAHAGDLAPLVPLATAGNEYRTTAYVIKEVEYLAKQLKDLER